MASLNKSVVRFSSKDLDQLIVEKNKSLDSRNRKIQLSIKDKEKELKSLDKQCDDKSKHYGKLLKDIEFQEEKMEKVIGGIYSNERLLSEKLELVSEAEKDYKKYKNNTLSLEKKKEILKSDIEKLEFYKSRCEESKSELAGLQVKKDSAIDELDKIKEEMAKSIDEASNKISYYENQYDILEEQAKKHEDMVHQFEQRLVETQDLYKEEEGKLNHFRSKSESEMDTKNNELQAITNLCNDTEDKYIEWEAKISKAKEKVKREENRTKTAKDNFAKWKIKVLEEVARLKLKHKVDRIDEAGLSEVLNG